MLLVKLISQPTKSFKTLQGIYLYEKWTLRTTSHIGHKFQTYLKYSTKTDDRKQLAKSDAETGSSEISTTFQTVKETTKTASYTGVILIGVAVTGSLFYAIFRELFSSKSPHSVYSGALDKCIKSQKIQDALGEPIQGFGEESARGRRRHVSHLLYEKNGINFLRMKFYIKGSRKRATVNLEMQENERGNYEYRYLFVEMDDYPNLTFVLEDNRTPALKIQEPTTWNIS